MLSGAKIRKGAECQVWSRGLYDVTHRPIPNGLLDPHMGPVNKKSICATCHGALTSCPSHLRKMRDPRKEVLQKNDLAKQVIKKCKPTCYRCGYVNGMVKKGGLALIILHDRSKVVNGDKISKECNKALSHIKDSKASQSVSSFLNPVKVLALFKKMLDEDCEVLYLSDRPEKLIITDIPVAPIPISPSVFMDGGLTSNENDITSKLREIISTNAFLQQDFQCLGSRSRCLVDWEVLQIQVAQYVNSDVRGVPLGIQQSSRPFQGLIQRLKGKQGRLLQRKISEDT